MSKVQWPGVKRVKAKGRAYYYWSRTDPMVRLPDPTGEPDAFMRKIAFLQKNTNLIEQRAREGTLRALIRKYSASKDKRGLLTKGEQTQRVYRIYLDRLEHGLGGVPLIELTPEIIQERVMDANEETPAAANMMLAILAALYKFGVKRDRRIEDWTANIDRFDAAGEHEPWPAHILKIALTSEDESFRRAVYLHLYTGQRTGDTCKMTWNSIRGARIPVKQDKTDIELSIPLHPDLAAELQRGPRTTLTILSNQQGNALKSKTFRGWCAAFSKEHGVKVVPHGLRKNAVNALLEAGCTPFEVHSVTGQSMQMIEHYAKRVNRSRGADAAILKWGTETKRERENSVK
ncbi:tyrosine-type recombinase/integrase [Pacificimonas sp. ICDLI1SI03]